MYYPPAICTSVSSGSKADPVFSQAGESQASPSKTLPAANTSSKEAEHAEDTAKLGDINKEVVQGAALPPVAPKIPSKEKEASQSMELVLATLPIPPKKDPKGKAQVSTTAASTQPPKNPKDKLVIKMKQQVILPPLPPPPFFLFLSSVIMSSFFNLLAFFGSSILMKIANLSLMILMLILIQT